MVGPDYHRPGPDLNRGSFCIASFQLSVLPSMAVYHLYVSAFIRIIFPYFIQHVCIVDVWRNIGESLGTGKVFNFYLVCGLGAGITQVLALTYDIAQYTAMFDAGKMSAAELFMMTNVPTLGASGAVMGIFAAFAYTFPNSQMIILPIPFPIKAKWALLGLAVLDLLGGVSSSSTGIAHFAHLGGAAVGIVIVMIWNRNNRRHFY